MEAEQELYLALIKRALTLYPPIQEQCITKHARHENSTEYLAKGGPAQKAIVPRVGRMLPHLLSSSLLLADE